MGVGGDQERATRTHIYIYIYIRIHTVLGLGPREPPSWDVCCKAFIMWEAGKICGNCNSCMQSEVVVFLEDIFRMTWTYILPQFENTAPHCTAPLFCFLIAFFLSLNLRRFASCQMTSTMAWNNIRVLTLLCCPSFWGASYLMKKLEKLSGFLLAKNEAKSRRCWFHRWHLPLISPDALEKNFRLYGYTPCFFCKYLDWSRWHFVRIQGAKGFLSTKQQCQIFDIFYLNFRTIFKRNLYIYIYIYR